MMGAGKTTVGRIIAEKTGAEFVDLDKVLERKLGRSVSQLFKLYGEETFRSHESRVLKDCCQTDAVISTGGGIVTRPENWKEIRRLGRSVFLNVDPDALITRLTTAVKPRPLLQTENWQSKVKELRDQRLPLYSEADITVDLGSMELEEAAALVLREAPHPW